MADYVDGFVLPVPRKNMARYKRMSRTCGKIWREYGALDYRECAGEDLNVKGTLLPFTKMLKLKPDETAVFAWITFKSRRDRDRINKKVLSDPRLQKMMDPKNPPFDLKRMAYGGFTTIVKV